MYTTNRNRTCGTRRCPREDFVSHRLSQIPRIAKYIAKQLILGAKGKAFPIAQLDNLAWFSSKEKKLPTVSLESIFPGVLGHTARLERAVPKLRGNLTADELCVVALVCQHVRPRSVFEFGTYNGRTTLNLALNTAAETQIYTLDLPTPGQTEFVTDKQDDPLQLGGQSGQYYRQSKVSQKIKQLWCDSAHFDETPYRESMDLVFVDASHTYEYVRNDSAKALGMIRKGGVILWHDYCVWYPGVARCLHELSAKHTIVHIEGTYLAVLAIPAVA